MDILKENNIYVNIKCLKENLLNVFLEVEEIL